MENKYLNQLKALVLDQMKDESVKVVLFGSRARGDHHKGSDVDLGLIFKEPLSHSRSSFLKDSIENSCIPYKVDVVDLGDVSKEFYEQALKDAVVWKNWN